MKRQTSSKEHYESRLLQPPHTSPEPSITLEGDGEKHHLLSDFLGVGLSLGTIWQAWNPNDTSGAHWAWIWNCIGHLTQSLQPGGQVFAELWGQLTTLPGPSSLEEMDLLLWQSWTVFLTMNCYVSLSGNAKLLPVGRFLLSALKPPGDKMKDLSILYSLIDINCHAQPAFKELLQLHDAM